jgi:N-acetylneuraminic acid mutarotase
MRHLTIAAAVATATLGLLSCDQSPTMPRLDQLTMDVVGGDGQTGLVGTELAPLIVKVTSGGNPVAGQVLNFRVVSGGGSVYGGTELTDDHGIAQELWTLGTKASELQKVEVRAVESNTGAQKVFGTFTATALAGPATLLKLAAGDQQTAGVGQPVATPPAALVSDQYGNPVAGTAVTFAVISGGGSVTGASGTTGSNGIATAGRWTLGPTAGTNTLTAMSAGLTGSPLTFTATATGPAGLNIANYRGDGQTQRAGTMLPIAPATQVTDQNGHPVAGVTVTFSVTAGGGSITSPAQLTDVNGIATVGSWTLGTAPGINELKATFNTGVSRGSTIFVGNGTAGNVWTAKASMPTARYFPAAATIDGILYALGGQAGGGALATVEAYDPAGNTWTTKASMPTARVALGVAVVNGVLYAVGGQNGSGGLLATVEAYDPTSNTWTTKASMPTARGNLGVAAINGILYAVGGQGPGGALATVEAYDPVGNTWTTKGSMPTARVSLGVAIVNGVLYAVGGYNSGGALATVEAYDPASNTWTTQASMPTARGGLGVAAISGVLYAVGGDNNGILATVEAYDPVGNTWTTKGSMPTARVYPGVAAINGMLYAVGGQNGGGVLATVEAYQP